jgi:hypothetical protein
MVQRVGVAYLLYESRSGIAARSGVVGTSWVASFTRDVVQLPRIAPVWMNRTWLLE